MILCSSCHAMLRNHPCHDLSRDIYSVICTFSILVEAISSIFILKEQVVINLRKYYLPLSFVYTVLFFLTNGSFIFVLFPRRA